jgi:hypothetical protein
MKKLNLSIITNEDGTATVSMGATCDDHSQAVELHADAANLLRKYSGKIVRQGQLIEPRGWQRLLAR